MLSAATAITAMRCLFNAPRGAVPIVGRVLPYRRCSLAASGNPLDRVDHIDIAQWKSNLLAGALPRTLMLDPARRIKRGIIGPVFNFYDMKIKQRQPVDQPTHPQIVKAVLGLFREQLHGKFKQSHRAVRVEDTEH